jgi:predicted secreted protein
MAASAARASFGALFYVGSTVYNTTLMATSTATMVALGEVLTVTAPTYTANTIDLTNQNTTEYFKEFISGVRDPGSLSITANYLSSAVAHQSVPNHYFYNGYKMAWALYLAGTSSMNCFTGFGYITSYTVTSPPDGAVTFAMTVKITGKPVGPCAGTSMA